MSAKRRAKRRSAKRSMGGASAEASSPCSQECSQESFFPYVRTWCFMPLAFSLCGEPPWSATIKLSSARNELSHHPTESSASTSRQGSPPIARCCMPRFSGFLGFALSLPCPAYRLDRRSTPPRTTQRSSHAMRDPQRRDSLQACDRENQSFIDLARLSLLST
jgi:hypothetical protein